MSVPVQPPAPPSPPVAWGPTGALGTPRGIGISILLPSEVGQMVRRSGRPSRVSGITGLWILLPIAGTIVWFVKVQGQLNSYWRSQGATG